MGVMLHGGFLLGETVEKGTGATTAVVVGALGAIPANLLLIRQLKRGLVKHRELRSRTSAGDDILVQVSRSHWKALGALAIVAVLVCSLQSAVTFIEPYTRSLKITLVDSLFRRSTADPTQAP